MKLTIFVSILIAISGLIAFNPITSFAESTGNIQLSVNYNTGDVASASVMSIKVYQDYQTLPFLNNTKVSALPFTISSLPLNHIYKVEVYQGSMYSGYGIVDLKNNQQNLNINIQPTMGLRFFVYYSDGQTPLSDAKLTLKSFDGMTVTSSQTDNVGQTLTLWVPTTLRSEQFYFAEVSLGHGLSYTFTPINALSPGKTDIKIVTNWPKEITNLISIQVYKDPTTLVGKSDGTLGIEIRDSQNKKIKDQLIDLKGEAKISNLKVGEYTLAVVKNPYQQNGSYEEIYSEKIVLNGSERFLKIVINESKTSDLKTDSTIPIIEKNPIPIIEKNPVKVVSDPIKSTKPKELKVSNCNCIAFTLDSIQDYYISNVQLAIIKSFQQKDVGLTAGVFGKNIGGNAKIVGQLKDMVSKNPMSLEIANRGWENVDHSQYSDEIQNASIQQTNEKISVLFNTEPVTFIARTNSINDDTIKALRDNGIHYYSFSGKRDIIKSSFYNTTPVFVPQTLQLSDLLEDDLFFEGTINEHALFKIRTALNGTGFAVASIQAKDYAVKDGDDTKNQVDLEQLQRLESLLDFLKQNQIKIITVKQLTEEIQSQKFPTWTGKILNWYEQGLISEVEVGNARNYLIQNVYSR